MDDKQMTGESVRIERSGQGITRSLSVAGAILLCSAVLHTTLGIITTLVTPWETIFSGSPVNRGLTTMGLVIGASFGVGLFIAVPIAAATDIRARRRRSLRFVILNLAAAVAALLMGYWIACIAASLAAVSLVLLVRRPSRSALTPADPLGRGRSLTVGYVLLVLGGLWGLHNFYLRRSWAGVLYIGLLIFGTGTWGGLMSFLCLGVLGGMLLIDLISLPTRVRRLDSDSLFIP
jgi:hypothetical protein